MRQYLVKIDNIYVPNYMKDIRAIYAENKSELLDKIRNIYNIPIDPRIEIQLWSARIGETSRQRLDNLLEEIPTKYEIIWVRGKLNI